MAEIWIHDCRWRLRAEPPAELERRLHDAGLLVMDDSAGMPVSLEPHAGDVPAAALTMLAEVAPASAEMAYAVWWPTENDVEMHLTFVVRGELREIVVERPPSPAAERRAHAERLARRAEVVDPHRPPGRQVRYGLDLVKAMPAGWSEERRLARMVEHYDLLVDAFLDLDELAQEHEPGV